MLGGVPARADWRLAQLHVIVPLEVKLCVSRFLIGISVILLLDNIVHFVAALSKLAKLVLAKLVLAVRNGPDLILWSRLHFFSFEHAERLD
jgi:hypothetical protein